MKSSIVKIFILLSITMLSACTNMAVTSMQAIYNRRSIEKSLRDQHIAMQAYQVLNIKTDEFKNANIAITAFNNEILLAGQVPYDWQKNKAEKLIKEISGLDQVYNLLSIGAPTSTLTKISDSWITTKVKAKLIASSDTDATQIKVVTENGTVYLMGTVKPEEGDAAAEIASTTDGVQNVMKVFSYLKISKSRD